MSEPISGYRTLSENEIALINEIKQKANECGKLVERLHGQYIEPGWVSIGTTHLQQGFMALVRAVAKPEGF